MARRVETPDGCGAYLVSDRPATCEACGVDCGAEEHAAPDPRGEPRGGWHVACRDVEACRRRATPQAMTRVEAAAAARLAAARTREEQVEATRAAPGAIEAPGRAWAGYWTTATLELVVEWEAA